MTATDVQVRIAMRERKMGKSQQRAAAKANLSSRKTVSKYEKADLLPSQMQKPRTHRTRADAFAQEWPTIEELLTNAPTLEAKAGCANSIQASIRRDNYAPCNGVFPAGGRLTKTKRQHLTRCVCQAR